MAPRHAAVAAHRPSLVVRRVPGLRRLTARHSRYSQRSARSRAVSGTAIAISLACCAALVPPAAAATCTVPGSHALIRTALADPGCTVIQLAAQIYPESPTIHRSLTLAGPAGGGAVVQGRLSASGVGVVAQVATLAVANGCQNYALQSTGGARIDADGVSVILTPGLPCLPELPFADDFESASTNSWSLAQP